MKHAPSISPAAYATLTRPLIREDGGFNRGAISARARREFRARRALTWSAAMHDAWALARRQLEAAHAYAAARQTFKTAPRQRWSARRESQPAA